MTPDINNWCCCCSCVSDHEACIEPLVNYPWSSTHTHTLAAAVSVTDGQFVVGVKRETVDCACLTWMIESDVLFWMFIRNSSLFEVLHHHHHHQNDTMSVFMMMMMMKNTGFDLHWSSAAFTPCHNYSQYSIRSRCTVTSHTGHLQWSGGTSHSSQKITCLHVVITHHTGFLQLR